MKKPFTLVEVLIAMSVLSVFLLGLMQFYSSTESVLSSGVERTEMFERARIAMDMMVNDLTCVYYSQTDDDITTPVSEQPAQASNVKVWSYEKTIYIQAAPMTDYRIIDATGRVLRSATTQTDRDEIRLGNLSAIVIVIINHKTYKINY